MKRTTFTSFVPQKNRMKRTTFTSFVLIRFNPWPIVARFDSHLNIPASHLGIPGGIENLDLQY